MEAKFKKGDKVRYIGEWDEADPFCWNKGDEFVVDGADNEYVLSKITFTLVLENEYLELVSRPNDDPKTAFLTELKELLEKYDAQIKDYEEYRVDIRIGNEWLSWTDKSKISGQGNGINADNIFDYDKD